jgi:hypothetical protein
MVRTALAFASGIDESSCRVQLKNVMWSRPLIVGGTSVEVHIEIRALNESENAYQIVTVAASGERRVHCEGRAAIGKATAAPAHDLRLLREQCKGPTFTAEQCYAAYEKMDVRYGPEHRALTTVVLGVDESGRQTVLTRIASWSLG